MRSTPYSFAAKTETAAETAEPVLNKPSYQQSVVRDLGAQIARPHTPATPPVTAPEKTASEPEIKAPVIDNGTTPTTPAAEKPAEGMANLGEDFEKFKDNFRKDAEQSIQYPKRAAKTTLQFINFFRTIAYPFLIKWGAFEDAEKEALPAILSKVFAAEKAATGTEAPKYELNAFEKRVFDKWQGYDKHIKTIPWSENELNFLAEVGHLKMQEIAFMRWLMGNEFLLAILFIEGRRFGPAITARMGFGWMEMAEMKMS